MTLLGVLMDALEKNETFGGYFHRRLPLPDAESAGRKLREFHDELVRWKGTPRLDEAGARGRRADWGDIRMKQAGRGVMVWARSGGVSDWWHEAESWADDPLADARDWDGPLDETR